LNEIFIFEQLKNHPAIAQFKQESLTANVIIIGCSVISQFTDAQLFEQYYDISVLFPYSGLKPSPLGEQIYLQH
jgi:hypothetical protein